NGWVVDVAWSPDGSRIATAAVDTTIRIWDARTYRLERVLRGMKLAEPTIAVSFDGRLIAALAGGQVDVVDIGSGGRLAIIHGFGPRSEQGFVDFTGDGAWLIVWLPHDAFRLPLDAAAYARSHLPRTLDSNELARFRVGTPGSRIDLLARRAEEQPSV